jgi:hypothetical protein
MTWRLRGWRSPGDDDARLDTLLAGTWNAAVEATGNVLDIQAGKEALLATFGQLQPSATAGSAVPRVSSEGSQPPKLKAYRQPREQRRTARTLTAVGAVAALAAGALAAADVTGAFGSGNRQQIQAAAYITRTKHVLASQAEEGLVSYSRTVFPPGTIIEPVTQNSWETKLPVPDVPTPRSPYTADVMVMWQYQNREADITSTATGQPVSAEQITGTARSQTVTGVSYRGTTWWRATQTLKPTAQMPAPGCGQQGYPGGSSDWPAYLRQELSCGVYHQDGRQWVDGIDAVKLTTENKAGRLVLWINPATYLPVRETDSGGPVPGQPSVQTDFRWFPATAASLAPLKVRVPAGFRQVQPPPAR